MGVLSKASCLFGGGGRVCAFVYESVFLHVFLCFSEKKGMFFSEKKRCFSKSDWMWSFLPDELVHFIIQMIHDAALPSVSLVDIRCNQLTKRRLSSLRRLSEQYDSDDDTSGFCDTEYMNLNSMRFRTNGYNLVLALAAALSNGTLAHCIHLDMARNNIDDNGMSAFADAVGKGSLLQLKELYFNNNQIGNAGMTDFAYVLSKGALPALKTLNLEENSIGDSGYASLADALSQGALARCTLIEIDSESRPEIEPSKSVNKALKDRWLDGKFLVKNLSNEERLKCDYLDWGDAEMFKLASAIDYACDKKALTQCTEINLIGNQIQYSMTALVNAVSKLPCSQLNLANCQIRKLGIAYLAEALLKGALTNCWVCCTSGTQVAPTALFLC